MFKIIFSIIFIFLITSNKAFAQHFQWPGGNAAQPTYSIYVNEALIDGSKLGIDDEIAVYDDTKIVGVKVLTESPIPGNLNVELAAFRELGDLSTGYSPSNLISFKFWNSTSDTEYIPTWDIVPVSGGRTENDFPSENNLFIVLDMKYVTPDPEDAPTPSGGLSPKQIIIVAASVVVGATLIGAAFIFYIPKAKRVLV